MIQRVEPVKTDAERVEDALQSLDRVLRSEVLAAAKAETDCYRRHKLWALVAAAEAYHQAIRAPMDREPSDG